MNFKTTIVLIVLLAVVGAWYAVDKFVVGPEKTASATSSTDSQTGGTGKKLLDVDANDVTKITITPADGKRIVLTKADAKWRLVEPVSAAAETWEVDGLVRGITDMRSRGEVETPSGLDPTPRYAIELTTKDGKTKKLAIGDKTAIGDVMYVRTEGEKRAEVVPADLYEKLEKPVDDLRDKQLVTVASTDIKQITIDDNGKKLSIRKNGSDWQMTEPEKMPVDEAAATSLTSAITGLHAGDFVEQTAATPTTQSSSKPLLTVWFSTNAPATQPTTAPATQDAGHTATFVRYEDIRKERVVANVDVTLAYLPAPSLDSFRKKPIDLRDKRVVTIRPDEVSAITVSADLRATTQPTTRPASKRETHIARRKVDLAMLGPVLTPATKPTTAPTTQATTTAPTTAMASTQPVEPPTKWQIVSDPTGDANDANVEALLADLNPLRAEKFTDDASPTTQPVDRYTISVTTSGAGGATAASYEIHITDPGNDKPLIADYNGLRFELPRTVLARLEAELRRK